MFNMEPANEVINTTDGVVRITMRGQYRGHYKVPGGPLTIVGFKDVAYVPGLSINLFSLTKAQKKDGCKLSGEGNEFRIWKPGTNFEMIFDQDYDTPNGCVIGTMILPATLGQLSDKSLIPATETVCKASLLEGTKLDIEVLHQRMGHPSAATTIATAKNLGVEPTGILELCKSCATAKSRQQNLKKILDTKAKEPGE